MCSSDLAHVDHGGIELLGRLQRRVQQAAESQDRHTRASAPDFALAEGQTVQPRLHRHPGTGTARARAEFPNPAARLRPGQFVRGHLTGYQRANALCVPRKAILQNPAGASVYILAEGTKVDTRPVTLGAWVDDSVIIEKGLAEGDRVVVEGVQRIAPGMTVELATLRPEAAKPEPSKPETAKPASTH